MLDKLARRCSPKNMHRNRRARIVVGPVAAAKLPAFGARVTDSTRIPWMFRYITVCMMCGRLLACCWLLAAWLKAFQCWSHACCILVVVQVLALVNRQERPLLRFVFPKCYSMVCVFVVVCNCLLLFVVFTGVSVYYYCCWCFSLWLLPCLWAVCLDSVAL